MNKTSKIVGLLLIIGIALFCIYVELYGFPVKETDVTHTKDDAYKNATYSIDGSLVTLKNGVSVLDMAPGAASKLVTTYFGNNIETDINADGKKDNVFILKQQSGGSGVFYYVAAFVSTSTATGYVGANGIFLGDRISPQSIDLTSTPGVVVVNYVDRKLGQSYTIAPSIGKSMRVKFNSTIQKLVETK